MLPEGMIKWATREGGYSYSCLVCSAKCNNTWRLALSVHMYNHIAFLLVLLWSYLIFLHNLPLKTQRRDVEGKSYGCINNSYVPEGMKLTQDKKTRSKIGEQEVKCKCYWGAKIKQWESNWRILKTNKKWHCSLNEDVCNLTLWPTSWRLN